MKKGYLAIIIVLFGACKKPQERSCWKGSGEAKSSIVDLTGISKIKLYDDIDLFILQDSLDYLEISSFDNILPFIESDISGDTLILRNTNKCNFLRDRDKKNQCTLHLSELTYLSYFGSGNIQTLTTLNCDNLTIKSLYSSSNATIGVNANYIRSVVADGNTHLTLSGSSNSIRFYQSQYCITNAFDLHTKNAYCVNRSTGDMQILATDTLRTELLDVGSVIYKGNPYIEKVKDIGYGKLIQK